MSEAGAEAALAPGLAAEIAQHNAASQRGRMARDAETLPAGPLVQSVGIAFALCALATIGLALVWLGSNLRQVPPDATALVTRFGRVVAVQGAGPLLAWPGPIDRVTLLPGPDRQLGLTIAPLPRAAGLDSDYTAARTATPPVATIAPAAGAPGTRVSRAGGSAGGQAGSYLTGDGGVVLLDAELTWRVADPVAYMLAEAHVAAALNRAFRAAIVAVAAASRLDDFLVVEPGAGTSGSGAGGSGAGVPGFPAPALREAARARLRDALLTGLNARLAALGAEPGGGLGVTVTRIDLTASLPPAAKLAFDSVLTATQVADQALANARADATRRRQAADQERDRLLNVARAAAAERVASARAHTATITALAAEITPANRANLLDQVYRTRLAAVMARIGHVTAIDARGGPRVILPGVPQ